MLRPASHFKVVLLGDAGAGKTSICSRFQTGHFNSDYRATVGATFHSRTLIARGRPIVLDVWDTAGAERYRSIGPMYCRGAAAAVVVYDQGDAAGAAELGAWVDLFEGGVGRDHYVVVAANKDDLEVKAVSAQDVEEWCSDRGIRFFQVSAKTGVGIDSMMEALADDLAASEAFVAVEDAAETERAARWGCC
jgi:small GTP-binding protein